MLQVARLGMQALADAGPLVRRFFEGQLLPRGAGRDRDGNPDLYYTIFALAGLQASDGGVPKDTVEAYLQTFGNGEGLDFVHLGALARCWAAIGREHVPDGRVEEVLEQIERYRSRDGGYDSDPDSAQGNAY